MDALDPAVLGDPKGSRMDAARYLEDGKLTIFKRSGVYYARLRISPGKKYLWRSLKTTDEQTAIRLGRRLLFQMEHRVEQACHRNQNYFPLSSMTTFDIVSGIIITARPQMEC